MNKKSSRFKNHLRDNGDDPLDAYIEKVVRSAPSSERKSSGQTGRIILAVFIVLAGFSFVTGTGFFSSTDSNIVSAVTGLGQPSADLLNRMNQRMVEMGYTDLSDEDLRSLRADGVTATFISNVRSLGFEDLTLEEARRLARADASSAFMAMMIELGYELEIDDFIELRNAGVTAHYTSNVHDLGYRDVTDEQLIRMRRIGLTTSLIEELQQERGEDIPLEEVIRYRISNQ